jgi:iron complex transport system permease protein
LAAWAAIAVAALVLLVALLVGVLVGASGLTPRSVIADLAGSLPFVHIDSGLSDLQQSILWHIRLPRVVLGALVGAMLAAAGVAYQGVFNNPLADPYLLGVSGGAALGATLAIVIGGAATAAGVPMAAFVGAIAAVAITYALGKSQGVRSQVTLILAGVAVSAFANAAQTFVQQYYSDTMRMVYSWLLGHLSTDGWREITTAAPYIAVAVVVIALHHRTLDAMGVGDIEAASLGVNPARSRLILVVFATLGTAAAVSVTGLIGFVGLVVPHAVRLVIGPAHRLLIPVSLLMGAAFLVLADVVARVILAPAEIPIGVVTAFVGAPFFLMLLRRGQGQPS